MISGRIAARNRFIHFFLVVLIDVWQTWFLVKSFGGLVLNLNRQESWGRSNLKSKIYESGTKDTQHTVIALGVDLNPGQKTDKGVLTSPSKASTSHVLLLGQHKGFAV